MNDRRTFLGLAGAAVVGVYLLGRPTSAGARFPLERTPAQWRQLLGPQRYAILREAGTERPFTSPLLNEHRMGVFVCAGCALPLFSSATKFESGTGWPSFWRALPRSIVTRTDRSLGSRGPKSCARGAAGISAMFSTTGPGRPACATA